MNQLDVSLVERAKRAREALWQWLVESDFQGWDPYDGLTQMGPLSRRYKLARLIRMYFHKFSPLNTRPLFGISRASDTQAIALLITAAVKSGYPMGAEARARLEAAWEGVLNASLRARYGHHCWNAHPFPVQMRTYFRAPEVPEVIGTEAVGSAALQLWNEDPSRRQLLDVIAGCRDFFIDELYRSEGGVAHFRYSPEVQSTFTPNVSAIAARYVVEANRVLEDSRGTQEASQAFDQILAAQDREGFWIYSVDLESGAEKHQIDFHQGFILDELLRYHQMTGREDLLAAWQRGIDFYWRRQFFPTGQGLYRYPRVWPANVQNQAQGILTFVRGAAVNPELLTRARSVLSWTLDHFECRQGYFAYLKYPIGRNAIPYLRWSNASMFMALSEFLVAGTSLE